MCNGDNKLDWQKVYLTIVSLCTYFRLQTVYTSVIKRERSLLNRRMRWNWTKVDYLLAASTYGVVSMSLRMAWLAVRAYVCNSADKPWKMTVVSCAIDTVRVNQLKQQTVLPSWRVGINVIKLSHAVVVLRLSCWSWSEQLVIKLR